MADIKENQMPGGTPAKLRGLDANGNSITPSMTEAVNAMPVVSLSSKGLMDVKSYNKLNASCWGGKNNIYRIARTSYNYARLTMFFCGMNVLYYISLRCDAYGAGLIASAQNLGGGSINLYYAIEPPYISIFIANNSVDSDYHKYEVGNSIYHYVGNTDYTGACEIVDALPENAIKM